MDDLPELPFEKVLSYLSLEDRLKSMAVSRRWYQMIKSFNVKSLCYSMSPIRFLLRKSRLVSGAFAQNFISSTRFASFFNTFGQSILANLKHLRLYDLKLNAENGAAFAQALNSFGQLEKLDLIQFVDASSKLKMKFKLNLPMLNSIHLERLSGIEQLTLEAPRLQKVKLLHCSSDLRLDLVHAESVEWLVIDGLKHIPLENLKSLKYLYVKFSSEIDSTFLSSLGQLKEIHLAFLENMASKVFEQKQRYGRTDLKVYQWGLLLNDPDDPMISRFENFNDLFVQLAKNPSRLADEIPFWDTLLYTAIEHVAPGSEINVLNRFTDLEKIIVDKPVQDIQRFLDFMKNFNNIVWLQFTCSQPQNLFDRLPEHCAIPSLFIDSPVSDFRFLFRLKNLMTLDYIDQINAEVIRKVLEELEFLLIFQFKHLNKKVKIQIATSKHLLVEIDEEEIVVPGLYAAIQLIFGETRQKKRKAEELLE